MKDKIIEIIKLGLRHSIAQAFLIFSGFLVVISMLWAKEYINVVFFTLFYALIVHYLTALRRHESLGKYAVGNDKLQILLFTLIYIFLFAWWAIGVWSMLFNLGPIKWCYPISIALPCVSFYAFALGLILMIVWLVRFFCKMFCEKPQQEMREEKDTYKVNRSCKNCDSKVDVNIPKGVSFENYPCPKCGVIALEK